MSRLFLVLCFLLIVVTLLSLTALSSRLRNRLSVRIAVLILASGPIALILLTGFNGLYDASLHTVMPWWSRILQVLLFVLGVPLILGLLVARYVTRPLHQFTKAIDSLKENNYQVKLRNSGILEFDSVFQEFNDLTKRLMREEELRKDLISDTSHELNTPVAAMLSQLTAMEEGVLPVTKARVRILSQQAARLTDLVAELNEYTKARTAAVYEEKTVIELNSFCQELQAMFEVQLKDKGMHLQLDIPKDFTLAANRASLERIMVNLIQNCLRYSSGQTIIVKATRRYLSISDNGQGVAHESLPYLFERFYRTDRSRSRETGGLGLGLAIVRELVHRQGWHVRAEDAHPGLGIVISF